MPAASSVSRRSPAGPCRRLVLALAALAFPALAGPSSVLARQSRSSQADTARTFAFRDIGPAVAGGRVTSVAGVPGRPGLYYVGAAAGGVWKTTDGGNSWDAIFEHEGNASIGAIALAPSNPSLVWVGTGEANIRNDISNGHGVYFSPDGGRSWQFKGLPDVGQIAKIVVDPGDPDKVFVAAVGHAWTPGPDRGVYRTTDGGDSWQKVLFVNDTTGAVDVEMDPGNPRVLFAATWQVRRLPWQLVDGGAGSGIWRSRDGGSTWQQLEKGLPDRPYGRIELAIGPTDPDHVYALVEAKSGMLWDSHDLGDTWHSVNDSHALNVRPFYFSVMGVSPVDDQTVYFGAFQLMKSEDGGRSAEVIDHGVHVDHHALWIDPEDPDRIIQGNDGGVYVTRDGGESWNYLDNLPIEQFYMVAADSRRPYRLCGGLQDNNAWCGPSHSLSGAIDGSDWFVVTGGDGEYAVPAPSDSDVLYVDSQNGYISRVDLAKGTSENLRPYLFGVEDRKPSELEYRFNWRSPIAVSPTDADVVYLGANVLFRSSDGGQNWSTISPDLTRDEEDRQVTSGGPVQFDISGAETYNTILSISLAPTDESVIWVGTDDGLVQVTRDGGQSWKDVTGSIPGRPKIVGGRVEQIGVSPYDPGTAYVAIGYNRFDDNHPYVYRTHDFGSHWQEISKGLPDWGTAHVVRESPNRKGFLVLGTDTGLFYSRDDGDSWKALDAGFPTVPVWDLQFVKEGHDLVVATHGRGLIVLDDVVPLEELDPKVESQPLHLFTTLPAELRGHRGFRGASPSRYSAPNPPNGAVIDYYLKEGTTPGGDSASARADTCGNGTVRSHPDRAGPKITILDSSGDTVATGRGAARKGLNRYAWNLRYRGPVPLDLEGCGTEVEEEGESGSNGPRVRPGTYTVVVSSEGEADTGSVRVTPDPTLPSDSAGFDAQLRASMQAQAQLSAVNELLNRIYDLKRQLRSITRHLKHQSGRDSAQLAPLYAAASSLDDSLSAMRDSLYNPGVQHDAPEDELHYLSRFHGQVRSLRYQVQGPYAKGPRPAVREHMKEIADRVQRYLDRFNGWLSGPVASYNQTARKLDAPVLVAGRPLEVKPVRFGSGR